MKLNSLVTGGASGIGYCVVKTLLQRGDKVFIFDIVDSNSDRITELKKLGVQYFRVDVSNVSEIKKAFSEICRITKTGGTIVVMVYNIWNPYFLLVNKIRVP